MYVEKQSDAASFGAALRGLHGVTCKEAGHFVPFMQVSARAFQRHIAASPDSNAHAIYTKMLPSFKNAEDQILSQSIS